MGNNASTEKPQRAPQKLSKPRVGSHASNSTNDRLHPTRSNVSVNRQYTNSYNVGPLPSASAEAFVPPNVVMDGIMEQPNNGEAVDPDNSSTYRGSKRLSGLFRSISSKSHPERVAQTQSFGAATAKASNATARSKSVLQTGVKPLTPTTPTRPVSSQDSNHGQGTTTEIPQEQQQQHLENRADKGLVFPWQQTKPSTSPNPTAEPWTGSERLQPLNHQIVRTQSEAALYVPTRRSTRRSSFGQVPGAATRPGQTEPETMTISSFRKSLPLASSSMSLGAGAAPKRRQSMPVPVLGAEFGDRAPTPSESDYRQLGGIRFGSLRITNDNPVSELAHATGSGATNSPQNTGDGYETSAHSLNQSVVSVSGDTVEVATWPLQPVTGSGNANFHSVDHSTPVSQRQTATMDDVSNEVVGDGAQESHTALPTSRGSHAGEMSDHPTHLQNGFVSASASESESVGLNEPALYQDSGYVSNVSFDSFHASTLVGKPSADYKPDHILSRPSPEQTHPFTIPDEMVDEPTPSLGSGTSSSDGDPISGVQRENSLRSRSSAILTSLWSRKSRDMTDSNTPGSRASSTHSRGASLPDSVEQDNDATEPHSLSKDLDGRANQPSKLKRLLKTKRRSLPADSTYIVQDATPMPFDAEDKLREHGFRVVGAPLDRPILRMEQSTDTLRTILSVGSAEHLAEDDASTMQQTNNESFAARKAKHPDQVKYQPSNISRSMSLLHPKPSGQQRRTILRKSMPVVAKPLPPKDDIDDDDLADTVQLWGYEAHMASIANIRHMAGNSAFDQAFVPMSKDYGMQQPQVRMPPPRLERPMSMNKGRHGWTNHPLRTRSSAPDFLETVCEPASPGGIDSTQQKPPKTPPPISLRTRGSKKSRRSRSKSQHHSSRTSSYYGPPPLISHLDQRGPMNDADGDLSFPRGLSQSLRSFPVQPSHGPHAAHSGYSPAYDRQDFPSPRTLQRGSWHGHPGHVRPQGPGMLHTYDTPSYRGPPIRSS